MGVGPAFGVATGANVVMVQAESLQAFVLGLTVRGQEITPFLNRWSRGSLLFSNVTVDEGSEVIQAVVLPQVNIGKHCRITRAIIDKRCNIPEGTVIGEDHAEDAKRFKVTEEGVVLVTPQMLP